MPIPLGILAVAGAGAGGGVAAYDLIETVSVTTASSTVEFYNINTYTDYKHLQFRMTFKNNGSGGAQPYMRMNGATTGSYAWHFIYGNSNGSPGSNSFVPDAYMGIMETAGYSTNEFNVAVIDILDFASTAKKKTIRVLSGGYDAAGYRQILLLSGLYNSTSSVTNISLHMPNNFSAGSRISLYGIKG